MKTEALQNGFDSFTPEDFDFLSGVARIVDERAQIILRSAVDSVPAIDVETIKTLARGDVVRELVYLDTVSGDAR